MEDKKVYYTEEGYQKLVTELEYLKGPKMKEVKESIAAARDLGDLSENSEYDEAKNEQAKVVTRIQEIEELLIHAVVISEDDIDTNVVHLGSTVKLFHYGINREVEYKLVGINEVDALNGKISDQSPIGAALIGTCKGQEVTVMVNDNEFKLKILEVWRTKNN